MFHVPFKANGRSKHVTMLRNVTDTFARLTLNLRKEGASVAVEAWEAALLSRTLGAASVMATSVITALARALPISTGVATVACWGGPTTETVD